MRSAFALLLSPAAILGAAGLVVWQLPFTGADVHIQDTSYAIGDLRQVIAVVTLLFGLTVVATSHRVWTRWLTLAWFCAALSIVLGLLLPATFRRSDVTSTLGPASLLVALFASLPAMSKTLRAAVAVYASIPPELFRRASLLTWAAGGLICVAWGYESLSSAWHSLVLMGGGGIEAVSVSVMPNLSMLSTGLLPLVVTFYLTRQGRSRLGSAWRWLHLGVASAMLATPLVTGFVAFTVVVAVFTPMQILFVTGALAIWLAHLPSRS
jgi:hypothetical protein